VASSGAFLINTVLGIGVYVFTASDSATDLATGSLIAPFIEEGLKGMAVLIVFWTAHNEFDSILDGIVYAAITAIGFAATENVYYIYQMGYVDNGMSGLFFLAFVRVILVGWQHPFYTAFIGIGLAVARLNRSWGIKILAVLLGFSAAIATHSAHNTLAFYARGTSDILLTTAIDWTGWLVMLGFIFFMINREKKMVMRYLGEEVQYGILTYPQYTTACSPTARFRAELAAIGQRRYRITSRFYQLCGEITHKKHQMLTLGNEENNMATIDQIRAELRQLSPWVS
jgi:hypothetical protein